MLAQVLDTPHGNLNRMTLEVLALQSAAGISIPRIPECLRKHEGNNQRKGSQSNQSENLFHLISLHLYIIWIE